jgi:hypothetical protein
MKNYIRYLTILLIISTFSFQLFAQDGMVSSGGDGTGSGGSFSFSLGQFAYQTFFENNSSVEQGLQHPFETSYVPSLFFLSDSTISSGIACFNALVNLTVAGDGENVIVQNGAVADFIAGKSIRFLPGFQAQPGSTVHEFITVNNNFCDGDITQSVVTVQPEEKDIGISGLPAVDEDLPPGVQVDLYPNPNHGKFKIDLINFEERATVCVYNLTGAVFYKSSLGQIIQNEVNIPYLRKGIYFVRIIGNNKQFVKKIIVN